ncbi:MAG: helix-turn-helix domain-containing protein [Simkania negevensis]|nr:helix-turn-helix domain-containing protein [Simkania negevensis]
MDGSLKKFLFNANLTVKAFANILGVSPSFVYHLINKKRIPSRDLAQKIEEFTRGKVRKEELLFPKELKEKISIEENIQNALQDHEERLLEIEKLLFKKEK